MAKLALVILLGLGAAHFATPPVRAADALITALTTPDQWPYAERQRATHRISRTLAADDVATLVAFLARPPENDTVRPPELRALKNNVADALIAQRQVDAGLLDAFLRLASDPAQDVTWREYLLQKLPDLALRLPDPEARTRATEFLRDRSESTEYILAGTAIIALERLGRLDPSLIGPLEIAQRATRILDHPDQANACKIAALQILGAVDAGEGRARALAVLAEPARPLMLKVSALATLGACGQAADRDALRPFLDSPDYRLRTAARAAAAKLEKATASG